jgi:flagellar motor switch protein FliG
MQQATGSPQQLTNLQKAAAILITLGPERSAEILSHMESDQVERIAREIARMEQLDEDTKRSVIEEFSARCRGFEDSDRGGIQLAAEIVRKALGPQKAARIMEMLKSRPDESVFTNLQRSDVPEILRLVADEQPQVIALVLGNLPAQKAAAVLAGLPEEAQIEVARRVAKSDAVMPKAVARLAKALERKASSMKSAVSESQPGKQVLLEILKNADRSTERTLLSALSERDSELGEFLREKLFVFEDLIKLEARSMQLLVREIEQEDLRVALRGAGDEIKEAFFQNMSEGAREGLKEELETGQPVRLKDVEAAQRKIAGVLRRMVESGTIIIGAVEEEQLV